MKKFQNTIRTKNLKIDLFEETLFLFAQFTNIDTPPTINALRNNYEKIS